jgi:glycosyltransferase involved in cell wall biosynthesis
MACGVPVIASDLPVTRELISQNQNGKLVRADRPSDLARTIRILLEEDDFRKKLGKEAQKTISDKFTWETQQKMLVEMYKTLN